MRGFPFGTFSSFNSLSFGGMTGPSAEREAPHATSPVAIEICSMNACAEGLRAPTWRQRRAHRRMHEVADVAAECRDFPNQRR